MRSQYALLIIILVLASALLTGCWDRVEIDQRGFVTGVAIDWGYAEGEQEIDGKLEKRNQKFVGTYQIMVPAGLKGGGDGSTANPSTVYTNISSSENSMSALSAKLSNKSSRTPYFEHLKVIIISQEVAKHNSDFADILDYFLRQNEMRRAVKVVISSERAEDVLKINAPNEKYPTAFLESTLKNSNRSSYMLPITKIGDVHEYLLREDSFCIQTVSLTKDGISVTGAAVFNGKTNRLAGFLNGIETQGLNFIRGQVNDGVIESTYEGKLIDLKIERAETHIRLIPEESGLPHFLVEITAEGPVEKSSGKVNVLNNKEQFKAMEQQFTKSVEQASKRTIHRLQSELKLDALGLGAYVRESHYRQWKQWENDWEKGSKLFASARIDVKANVFVRHTGNINESNGG